MISDDRIGNSYIALSYWEPHKTWYHRVFAAYPMKVLPSGCLDVQGHYASFPMKLQSNGLLDVDLPDSDARAEM